MFQLVSERSRASGVPRKYTRVAKNDCCEYQRHMYGVVEFEESSTAAHTRKDTLASCWIDLFAFFKIVEAKGIQTLRSFAFGVFENAASAMPLAKKQPTETNAR